MITLMSPELENVIDVSYNEKKIETISFEKDSIVSTRISINGNQKSLTLSAIFNKNDFAKLVKLKGFFRIENLYLLSKVILLIESIDIVYHDEKECHSIIICKITNREN